MNCDNIKDISLAYFAGELNTEQKLIVDSHLQNCKSCSHYYAFSKTNFSAIEKAKRKENDPFFYSALMAKMENQNSTSTVLSHNPALRLALLTIIMIISVFSGLFIGNYSAETLNTASTNETIEIEQLGFDLANNDLDIFTNFNTNNNE